MTARMGGSYLRDEERNCGYCVTLDMGWSVGAWGSGSTSQSAGRIGIA
jgi:hypothetical protein